MRPPAIPLLVAVFLFASPDPARAAERCVDFGSDGTVRKCNIETVADCQEIADYPYARNLFCPTAFAAAGSMVEALSERLGGELVVSGFFHYFQTVPGSGSGQVAQTTTACMDTVLPSGVIGGAGRPLCELVAYVTSPGPVAAADEASDGNPVPGLLRGYPDYFRNLYWPGLGVRLRKFRSGAAFDPIIRSLGANGYEAFTAAYSADSGNPFVPPDTFYDPDGVWADDPAFFGISGGGGNGWGAQLAVFGEGLSNLSTLLTLGGGGGGGMTSTRTTAVATRLGSGGGGGMQFADGYLFRGKSYDGLGLGAGANHATTQVQYSYNDGSGSTGDSPHTYKRRTVRQYHSQLRVLRRQLKRTLHKRGVILIEGGGGMGAGTEYVDSTGSEIVPHALSTQGGFHFGYTIAKPGAAPTPAQQATIDALNEKNAALYNFLGPAYRTASSQAYIECGRNYDNYACMCAATRTKVLAVANEKLGADEVPNWLKLNSCPSENS